MSPPYRRNVISTASPGSTRSMARRRSPGVRISCPSAAHDHIARLEAASAAGESGRRPRFRPRSASLRRRSRARGARPPPRSAATASCRDPSSGAAARSLTPAGFRTSAGHERRAVVHAREEPLEQVRLADEDVDHVDAAAVARRPRRPRSGCSRAARRAVALSGRSRYWPDGSEPETDRDAPEDDRGGDEPRHQVSRSRPTVRS